MATNVYNIGKRHWIDITLISKPESGYTVNLQESIREEVSSTVKAVVIGEAKDQGRGAAGSATEMIVTHQHQINAESLRVLLGNVAVDLNSHLVIFGKHWSITRISPVYEAGVLVLNDCDVRAA